MVSPRRFTEQDIAEVMSTLERLKRRGEYDALRSFEGDQITLRLLRAVRKESELDDGAVEEILSDISAIADLSAEKTRAEIRQAVAGKRSSANASPTGRRSSREKN